MNMPVDKESLYSPEETTYGNKARVNDRKELVHVIRRSQALNQKD
jgi:hypothetical protein